MVAVAITQGTAPVNIQRGLERYSAKKISGSFLSVLCGGTMTALFR
jgi:hypothetical protein